MSRDWKNDDWKGEHLIRAKGQSCGKSTTLSAAVSLSYLRRANQGITQKTAGHPWSTQIHNDVLRARIEGGAKGK